MAECPSTPASAPEARRALGRRLRRLEQGPGASDSTPGPTGDDLGRLRFRLPPDGSRGHRRVKAAPARGSHDHRRRAAEPRPSQLRPAQRDQAPDHRPRGSSGPTLRLERLRPASVRGLPHVVPGGRPGSRSLAATSRCRRTTEPPGCRRRRPCRTRNASTCAIPDAHALLPITAAPFRLHGGEKNPSPAILADFDFCFT